MKKGFPSIVEQSSQAQAGVPARTTYSKPALASYSGMHSAKGPDRNLHSACSICTAWWIEFLYNLSLISQNSLYNLSKVSIISQKLSIIKISLYFAQNQDILGNFSHFPYNLSLLSQNTLYNLSKTLCNLSKNSL